jgi:CRP-like cAMP-binding protein
MNEGRNALIQFLHSSGYVSPAGAEIIANEFSSVALAKGSYFLEAGKLSNYYLFLEDGFMRAFAYDTNGLDISTAFYAAGQVVFEVSSFFNRTRSKENIIALTDCKGWSISYEELNQLFHGMPEFRDFGRHILVKGFATLKERMLSMITESAEERYQSMLQRHPELLQHVPLKHIASYLGITDTSLSRIRKEFSKKSTA